LTEEQQGGTKPPAEATAEAPATEQTVGTVAVADEPASSPSLDTEAMGTETAMDDASEQVAPPEAAAAPEPLAPDTATPEAVAMTEPDVAGTAEAVDAPEAVAETAEADAPAAVADPAEAVADEPVAEDAAPADDAAKTEGSPEAAETVAGAPEPVAAPDAAAASDADAEPAEAAAASDADAEPAQAAAASDADAEPAEAAAVAEPVAEKAPARPVPTGPEPTTMEELLAEQDSDIKSFKHGDVVEGSVVRIDKDEILVDIGAKSEGVVSNRELFGRNTEAQPALNIGDTVLVYVLQPESPEGHVVLSLRRAGLERKWRSMQEQFEAGVIIEAPVIDHNKGGLIVDCGIRGFVPISQIVDFPRRPQNDQPRDAAQEIAEKLQPFVGRKLRLKILEVNRKANRLILSEKVALYEERREKRDELFSSLQVGQRVKGSVRSIAPFGVFVDLGGIDGLVHKSELSWNKVNNPEGGYKVGEEVEAEVIDINHERGRISLSIRRLQPDPWHSTVADFKVGDIIDGTVTKLVNFGAFVRVRDGLEGLIHISELSNQRVAHPGDVVHEGQSLKLRIISLDSERHRLGLSLKQAEEAPARPAPEQMDAMPAAPRERTERPERGDRRPRGDRERTRTYTAADAVQEPEGGIDTTLAAAFAGVREQLARAEAEDDGTGAEPTAEAEADVAVANAPAADETEVTADAPEAAVPEEEPAGMAEPAEAEPEAVVEPAEQEPEAVAEPAPEPAEETPIPEAATEAATEPESAEPVEAPTPKKADKPKARDAQAAKAATPTADAVAESGGEVEAEPTAPKDEAGSVATAAAEGAEVSEPPEPVAGAELQLATDETEDVAPEAEDKLAP
jgi:small subunit ribosomal protein S1